MSWVFWRRLPAFLPAGRLMLGVAAATARAIVVAGRNPPIERRRARLFLGLPLPRYREA